VCAGGGQQTAARYDTLLRIELTLWVMAPTKQHRSAHRDLVRPCQYTRTTHSVHSPTCTATAATPGLHEWFAQPRRERFCGQGSSPASYSVVAPEGEGAAAAAAVKRSPRLAGVAQEAEEATLKAGEASPRSSPSPLHDESSGESAPPPPQAVHVRSPLCRRAEYPQPIRVSKQGVSMWKFRPQTLHGWRAPASEPRWQ